MKKLSKGSDHYPGNTVRQDYNYEIFKPAKEQMPCKDFVN